LLIFCFHVAGAAAEEEKVGGKAKAPIVQPETSSSSKHDTHAKGGKGGKQENTKPKRK